MRASQFSLVLIGIASAGVLLSGAAISQTVADVNSNAPAPSVSGAAGEPSASQLIDTPVTKIYPGDVDLAPKIANPAANDPEAVTRGKQFFTSFNCIGCHADNGGGGMGPALSNRAFIYGSDPANIYLTIAQGRPNGMPAWGAVLPENAIWDLVTYVQSLSQEPKQQWGETRSLEAFKIEQVPAEFQNTPQPWKYTQPFTNGQKPAGG